MLKYILILIILFTNRIGFSQEIEILNPSFEGKPGHSLCPEHWHNAGHPDESPPDTQPGSFNVEIPPQKDSTYLGLAVRDNDSWEVVSQKLENPMKKNVCYSFSIHLSMSNGFYSISAETLNTVFFTEPVKLRIWAGNDFMKQEQLLAESNLIDHEDWKKYEFEFLPNKDYSYLFLEAYFKTPSLQPYNGHILIDNASSLQPIENCKIQPKLSKVKPILQTVKKDDINE